MADHNYFANLIWQIAGLLRGPYRTPQYERVMLPMTVLRRFDCVLALRPKYSTALVGCLGYRRRAVGMAIRRQDPVHHGGEDGRWEEHAHAVDGEDRDRFIIRTCA